MSAGHIVLTVWGVGVGLILVWAGLNYYHSSKKYVQCCAKEYRKPGCYYIYCVRNAGHKGKHRSNAGREF